MQENNHTPKVSIGIPVYNGDAKPLITTIIPTYRRPKLLQRAIKSVLNQTYPDFQVCVYDNASWDETADVVAEIAKKDARVKYHCHTENIGAIKNFIYGMDRVETPLFTLLSDDDLILPNFFEIGLAALEKAPEAIFFAGATIRADFEGNIWSIPLDSWRDGVYYPPEGLLEMLKKGHPEWTGIIFRKEVLSKDGIDVMTGVVSDLDFELRIAAKHIIVISKTPCAIFVGRPIQKIPRFKVSFIYSGWLKMIENISSIEELSNEVRKEASQLLMGRLHERVFMAGIRGAITGFRQDTLQAAEVLRNHFKDTFRSSFLHMLASDLLIGGFLGFILRSIRFIRRFCRRKKAMYNQWQRKYGYLKGLFLE